MYFGGASSNVNDTGLLSNVTAMAGIDELVAFSDCRLFALAWADRSLRGWYRCGLCEEPIGGRYSN